MKGQIVGGIRREAEFGDVKAIISECGPRASVRASQDHKGRLALGVLNEVNELQVHGKSRARLFEVARIDVGHDDPPPRRDHGLNDGEADITAASGADTAKVHVTVKNFGTAEHSKVHSKPCARTKPCNLDILGEKRCD